jgi:uncharacterized protein
MKFFWKKFSHIVLSKKGIWLLALAVLTVVMLFFAVKVQLSYELAKILPKTDPNFQLYESFKQRYGEDGNIMVLGIEDPNIFELGRFQNWYDLGQEIRQIEGIKEVVSIANLKALVRNDSAMRFDLTPVLKARPRTQIEVDTTKAMLARLPVYKGLIFSEDNTAHLMLATFSQSAINDKSRISIVKAIKQKAEAFSQKQGLSVHLSGMPYIRTELTSVLVNELMLFLVLAVGVTALILAFFFRSFQVVFFALLVVLIGVVASVGIMSIFGYKITILTGLIPPIIVIIGVPNTIFILNKYHEELRKKLSKIDALHITIEKIGPTLFLANVTTSIGFGVFMFTGSAFLVEFGQVASLSIMLTYLISIVFVPIFFSYLAAPSESNMAHFQSPLVNRFLDWVDVVVHNHRSKLYWVIAGITTLGVIGLVQIKAIGFVVDDLPADNVILTDLKWVEKHFRGVMPFEVSIDAGKAGGATNPLLLNKIKRMEKEFAKYPEFAEPISLVKATKFIYQAYRGGSSKYFVLPGIDELSKLKDYKSSTSGREGLFNSFLDSTRRYTRVSFQMADVGTVRTTELRKQLQGKIDTIFGFDADGVAIPKDERFDAKITGNAVVYALQNDYLAQNLIESTILAIILIAFIMWLLFANWKLIPVAILPSLIPLIITAGLMGFAGIALKPSTILIFSIAFGVSSDGTIYFLTRYKDEFLHGKMSIAKAISHTIMHTGVSMFYTAIILFSGFFIFVASTFKGTQALGMLVSITLLMGMICNLILLPAMLMTIDKRSKKGTVLSEEN